jgi:hypothetical protein
MSKRLHGKNGQLDSGNPIIAAVQRSLQGRKPTIVLYGWKSVPMARLRAAVPLVFDDETIREVGSLVLLSLLTGDPRMIKTVTDAIKEADHIFNRDRELGLFKEALSYMLGEGKGLDPETLKKGIEDRFNRGKKLHQYQWNRIRKVLKLPKLPPGRRENRAPK